MSDLPRPTVCRGVGQSRLQSKAVQHGPSSGISATILAQHTQKRRIWGVLSALGELFRAYTTKHRRRANFFALAPTPGRAGRQISRTARRNTATLKPTPPPFTPNKGPLKPPSPLRPKNAPKYPFPTRKGDNGFNPTQAQASKGDDGFRPPGHLANRAWLRRPWAAARPGRTTSRRARPYVSTPVPTGVEGTGTPAAQQTPATDMTKWAGTPLGSGPPSMLSGDQQRTARVSSARPPCHPCRSSRR